MDILLLQFCAVARENMERAVFTRMAERFEVITVKTALDVVRSVAGPVYGIPKVVPKHIRAISKFLHRSALQCSGEFLPTFNPIHLCIFPYN